MGGTGKSPLVIKIAKYLKKTHPVTVLSRGYKRKFKTPCITDGHLSAYECGDEPFMIYKNTGVRVYVNKKREDVLSLNLLPDTVLILDDGFQYYRLHRDIDIVIMSEKLYKHKGYVFPFGMLREPVSHIKRAHIVIVNFRFCNIQNVTDFMGKKTFSAGYKIDGLFDFKDNKIDGIKKAILISAIAKNREFLNVVRDKMGIDVKKHIFYRDHSYFSEKFLEHILKENLPVITTEKDFYRIPEKYRKSMLYLKISLQIRKENDFFKTLDNILNRQS